MTARDEPQRDSWCRREVDLEGRGAFVALDADAHVLTDVDDGRNAAAAIDKDAAARGVGLDDAPPGGNDGDAVDVAGLRRREHMWPGPDERGWRVVTGKVVAGPRGRIGGRASGEAAGRIVA